MILSKNFTSEEFTCPDCGESKMDQMFIERLQSCREVAGIPFKITSGFRCAGHNAKVGGVADSAHTRGLAAVIAAETSGDRFVILHAAYFVGFRRIGVSETFVHLDMDPNLPADKHWLYPKK